MLNYLFRHFWRKRRLLFHYYDGTQRRSIDPIVAAMRIHEHDVFLYRHLVDAAEGDLESQRITASVACDVFDVEELSPDGKAGLTVSELLELMYAFDTLLIELKKNIVVSQTPQGSTGSTSERSNAPTTNDTLASGSTDIESPQERQTSIESGT